MADSTARGRSRAGCIHITPAAPPLSPLAPDSIQAHLDALGVELWLTLRWLDDWIGTPVERRAALAIPEPRPQYVEARRTAAQIQASALKAPLEHIRTAQAYPHLCSAAELARSCELIAAWAENADQMELAVQFAERSAYLTADDARRANHAARLNRELGSWQRADMWYQRGIALARKVGDEIAKVRAYLGRGTLWYGLGEVKRASKLYQRAAWGAQRLGVKWLAAEVHHDMMLMAIETGEYTQAETFAYRAFRCYPVHHERIPKAVHDVALLLVWKSHFSPAISLLERVAERIPRPAEKAFVWSTLARAKAGAGRRAEYADLQQRVQAELGRQHRYTPAALINLAFGAFLLGMPHEARQLAEAGLELAREKPGCRVEERAAVDLLSELANHAAPPRETPVSSPDAAAAVSLRQLIQDLGRIIEGWRGPTWRRKRQAGQDSRGKV